MDREKRTHNSTYPKVAVQWLNQALCFYQSSCLVDSEALLNRHLRLAAKRCASYNKTLHMIGEVKNEIQKAIDKLNLTETDIQLLDNILNETIYNECVAYFVKSGDRRWWWENFKFQTFSITEFENPFNYIDKIIPLTSENVWFVVEDDNEPFYPIYDCNPNVIKDIIGECFGFEYYIIDKNKEWLLCENHHNRLIAIGEKLKQTPFNWQID